jgi:glutamyl-tRNA synthetase
MDKLGVDLSKGPDLKEVVLSQRERSKTLVEMAQKSKFLYEEDVALDTVLLKKHFSAEALQALQLLVQRLQVVNDWTKANIHEALNSVVAELGIKLGIIAQPVRIAVTGTTVSPSIDETLYLLGTTKSLKRLQDAIEQTKELSYEP